MTRQSRVDHLISTAPPSARFMGYGGTSRAFETAVFSLDGFEIRFPFRPSAWIGDAWADAYDAVASEYGCLSGPDWETIAEQLSEYAA